MPFLVYRFIALVLLIGLVIVPNSFTQENIELETRYVEEVFPQYPLPEPVFTEAPYPHYQKVGFIGIHEGYVWSWSQVDDAVYGYPIDEMGRRTGEAVSFIPPMDEFERVPGSGKTMQAIHYDLPVMSGRYMIFGAGDQRERFGFYDAENPYGGIYVLDVQDSENFQFIHTFKTSLSSRLVVKDGMLFAAVIFHEERVKTRYLIAYEIQEMPEPEPLVEQWRVPFDKVIEMNDIAFDPRDPDRMYIAGKDVTVFDMSGETPQILQTWSIDSRSDYLWYIEALENSILLTTGHVDDRLARNRKIPLTESRQPEGIVYTLPLLYPEGNTPEYSHIKTIREGGFLLTDLNGSEQSMYVSRIDEYTALEPHALYIWPADNPDLTHPLFNFIRLKEYLFGHAYWWVGVYQLDDFLTPSSHMRDWQLLHH